MSSELRKEEREIRDRYEAVRLLQPRCPKCKTKAGLFITRQFRELLAILLSQIMDAVPDGVAFTYKCPWCKRVRTFTIADLVGYELENLTREGD